MTDARGWQSDGSTPGAVRPPHSARRNDGGADPTDPEVPDAKRRRAMRRRTTLIVAGLAITGLVAIVLLLLYRMGQQVTSAESLGTRGEISAPAAAISVAPAPSPIILPQAPTPGEGASSRASTTGSTSGPAPRAKSPTAPDIIRKPAF